MGGCTYKDGGLDPMLVNTDVNGIPVDSIGRSRRFTVFSCARPWFRGFHFSWMSFFLAFLGWFAMVPALEYLVADPDNDIDVAARKTSNIVSVLGTIFLRLAMGPILEKFGPRRVQSTLLTYGAIMVMISATVNSKTGLYVMRFLISFVGGAFVPCQYWTTMLFGQEVVGQANAFAGGWGNLGGGFTGVFVAALITAFRGSHPDNVAWRYAMIIPGLMMLCISVPMWFLSDDCPQGHWNKRLYRNQKKTKDSAALSPSDTASSQSLLEDKDKTSIVANETYGPWVDWRCWVLFIQYATCFGVELAINNSMTSYLYRKFTKEGVVDGVDCSAIANPFGDGFPAQCSVLGKDTAAMIAALFGLQNLYARALGGLFSDRLNRKFFMRGRLWTQFICLCGEGIMLMVFSRIETLGLAIFFLIMFSIFVQMSEGTTYAIVPFMRTNVGVVAGLVGAGGNTGAVLWATMFKSMTNTSEAYLYLGIIVFISAFFTFILPVRGTGIFFGENKPFDADDAASDSGDSEMADESQHGSETSINAANVSSV